MITESVLHNGVKFICDTVENTLTCSVGFFFSNGSRDETVSTYGFAHFLEHMLFKGTTNRSAYDIAREIDCVGGSINAFTDKEITCYYCTVPAVYAELAVEVLSDMISHPTLSEDDITKEKIVVVNEMRASEDSPEERSYQYYLNKLWQYHPLSRKIAGEIAEVENITPGNLREFYETVYRSDGLTVVIAGNINCQKIISVMQKSLTDLNFGVKRFIRNPPERFVSRDYMPSKYQQAQIYLGTVLNSTIRDMERFYCFLVFSTAFGESISSRLFQHIREDLGLCYSVESFRTYYSDTWLWTIYASAIPGLVPQLLESLNVELNKLCNQPLSSKEVNDAINYIAGGMVFAQEDMEIRMKRLVNQQQIFGKVINFKEAIKIVRSISHLDVAGLSNDILQEGQFNLLSYGIKKTKQIQRLSFDW